VPRGDPLENRLLDAVLGLLARLAALRHAELVPATTMVNLSWPAALVRRADLRPSWGTAPYAHAVPLPRPASMHRAKPEADGAVERETERVRTRVRLLVEITAREGSFRKGLLLAASRLTPAEAAVFRDLEDHGLDVPRLKDVLWGAHVLIDDPGLYESWRFPHSRERLSSHHKTVDKGQYPDLGLKGPLVREKLHGRTAAGTWVQLEKTPASMGDGFHFPTRHDLAHLADFIVYRITKRNVGPWGRSASTEKRPMYLSPDLRARVPLPEAASDDLTATLERLEDDDDTTSASPDLARLFPPPDRADTLAELVFTGGDQRGGGLFGGSNVWVSEVASAQARLLLVEEQPVPEWTLPPAGTTRTGSLAVGDRRVPCAVRVLPPGAPAPVEPVPRAATAVVPE
jgi:hypothetical protein